jgi:putative hydrolase of the HAD superfamily
MFSLSYRDDVLPNLGLSPYIDHGFFSGVIGLDKKQTELWELVYQYTITQTPEIQKHEIIHIGDNETKDYEIPKEFGFDAFFLNRNKNMSLLESKNYILQKSDEKI